jgi:DNA-binding transcriptional LysR family regulator
MLDLSALEIFRTVAEEQSVTRAAQRLDRVQSNVTTRVKQLEDELNVQLFSRDGKRMMLTANGERLLGYAERLLALAEEARQAMQPERPTGQLRIGAMESTAAARLPSVVAAYHGRWPDVQLDIATGTSGALLDALRDSRIDCALVARTDEQAAEQFDTGAVVRGLRGTRVFREELLLVLPASHPPVRSAADLRVRTLAAFARGCTYREVGGEWLAGAAARDKPWRVMEMASYHAMLACVAAGSCVAFCPKSVLDLQAVPLAIRTHPVMAIDTWFVCRSGYSSSACDALLLMLQDAGAAGADVLRFAHSATPQP